MFKVLIVDDEPQVIYGLSKQIDWEAYNLQLAGTATNGEEALALLEGRPVDLLMADVCMPQMDGLTMIARAKRMNPALRCIVISAFSEFEFVKKALQLGVENYLLKPINDNELQETLALTLENLERDRRASKTFSPDLHAFRTNILDRWVNGKIQEYELEERAEVLNIELSAPEYRVCVVECGSTEAERIMHSAMLLELCGRLKLAEGAGECFADASMRVVCIWYGQSLGSLEERMGTGLQRLVEDGAARGLSMFASLGPISRTSAHVSLSYAAAGFHLNYKLLDPTAGVYICKDGDELRSGSRPQDLLQPFGAALKEGLVQQAEAYAKQYIDSWPAQPSPGLKGAAAPLALSLVRAIKESGRAADAMPKSIVDRLAQFGAITSAGELAKWLADTIRESVAVMHDRKGALHLLVHRALEQLHRNYGSELSLKTLAAELGVSPAYFGQLFKEETGKYYHDYLTLVRLQASEELLLNTDLKIGEIIGKIGIPNQSYYNRVFKKMYGISPVEFRRQGLKR